MKHKVSVGKRTYPIVVDSTYESLPYYLSAHKHSRFGFVISHSSLLRRYADQLLQPLRRAGWGLETLTVPEAESTKSIAMVQRLIAQIARRSAMRVPVLFAFGGGVVGDLVGFVAAIFRRGIPYVQVPTTLLAQVDSAIGGKTAVDLPQGKNLIGAYYHPLVVFNNTAVLKSLPLRQRRSGMSEIIKYGVIADDALFRFLEQHLDACFALEDEALCTVIDRSCGIKARVVSLDEREVSGLRLHLNFGHTLGHALEAATGYERWTHGEAIAIGMCAASRLAVEMKLLSEAARLRIEALIQAAGLPTIAGGVSRQAVMKALRYDKKFVSGRPRWVLPVRIGKVIVTEDVTEALFRSVLEAYVR